MPLNDTDTRPSAEPRTDSRVAAELIVHLGRLAATDERGHGLSAAQWSVLRYFAHANRFSCTPSAFAAFHGTTRGTASQTIKSLETKGYLERSRSGADGRSSHITLTDTGRSALARDPLTLLCEALDELPAESRETLLGSLEHTLARVALHREACSFGTCRSCTHLEESAETGAGGCGGRVCRCVDEPMESHELDRLCVNFSVDEALLDRGYAGGDP